MKQYGGGEAGEAGTAPAAFSSLDERAAFALEAGGVGTWEWCVDSGTVEWSPALERIHGIEPGSFPGTFEAYRSDIHPEDEGRVLSAIRGTLEGGEEHHIEYRIVRPDGSIRWVEGRGRLLRDRQGQPRRMIGICMDVTDRRRAEESRDLLVRELNHRLKNTLAIVQSIAGQTLRESPDPERFRACFSARLAALAGAHDLLDRESWRAVALPDLVGGVLAPFGADEPAGCIGVEGPALTVAPDAAVTLSLLLHELATNSAKYGALSRAGGRIDLSWAREAGDAPGWIALCWREQGARVEPEPEREGFGSRLIEASVAQLGGELCERRFCGDGLRLRLRFPSGAA